MGPGERDSEKTARYIREEIQFNHRVAKMPRRVTVRDK